MPALAESSAPLRLLLNRKNEYVWTPECQASFDKLKKQVANIIELKHFAVHKDIRIECHASHNGLEAVLEQRGTDGWRPISFASRYLNDIEKRYSTNELEILAVDCYHKALVSLLNGKNKKNKNNVQPPNQAVRYTTSIQFLGGTQTGCEKEI